MPWPKISINLSTAGPPTIKNIVGIMSSITGIVRSAGSRFARSSNCISCSLRISLAADRNAMREWGAKAQTLSQSADDRARGRRVDALGEVRERLIAAWQNPDLSPCERQLVGKGGLRDPEFAGDMLQPGIKRKAGFDTYCE